MKTVTIEWEDGNISYESFKNENELWNYIREAEKSSDVKMKDWYTDSVSMYF